jgi:hypothetical protein
MSELYQSLSQVQTGLPVPDSLGPIMEGHRMPANRSRRALAGPYRDLDTLWSGLNQACW